MASDNLEWLNLNSLRNYPIKEDCSRYSGCGFFLPNELIVDAVFVVNNPNTALHIKHVENYPNTIIIKIYDTNDVYFGNITINKDTHVKNDVYYVVGVNEYAHCQGKLVIGKTNNICFFGDVNFLPEQTMFESSVVIPNLRGVSSLLVDNYTEPLYGDINIKAGYNVRLRVDNATNSIYIDAIEGEGLGPECQCENEEEEWCIKRINGVLSDSSNNFNIYGIGCIEVESIVNGIKIKNTCEEVCCDCDEIQDLEASLEEKQTKITELESRVEALEGT
jgi:hypothetical protein